MSLTRLSKFISLILRHQPQVIGITLDEHGWADVGELLEGIRKTRYIDMEMLEEIVRSDEKQRYSFSENKALIRANQGHSVPVDVELPQTEPPDFLFHGTSERSVSSISQEGLLPMGRLYVHLSADRETARKVGSRHGKPVVFQINSRLMAREEHVFFRSVNGVWLTRQVPPKYLSLYQDQSACPAER
ncbi:MAG: RNA 2'-phosphotransferase [Hungatella sp.]|nr:RNA 2'-phosphotransferase [Hungatella sp.]MCI9500783.1 RNA 2'-phosphotransferase [Hungatella sp.]